MTLSIAQIETALRSAPVLPLRLVEFAEIECPTDDGTCTCELLHSRRRNARHLRLVRS